MSKSLQMSSTRENGDQDISFRLRSKLPLQLWLAKANIYLDHQLLSQRQPLPHY